MLRPFTERIRRPFTTSGEVYDLPPLDLATGFTSAVRINDVKIARDIENVMLKFGTTYDAGRIGAEIAYAVARKYLYVDDAIIVEPSQPGVDLYSRSGRVVIQARVLVERHYPPGSNMDEAVRIQLADMQRSIRRDLRRFPAAEEGYVILSLADAHWRTNTLLLKVRR